MVSYLPKGISINTNDFNINISYKKEGNKIIYTKKIIFNNPKIDKKDFEKWNDFNKKLDNIYNEQIVLKKA